MTRLMKAVCAGMAAGIVLLCVLLSPYALAYYQAQSESLIRQSNLTPARGEAFDAYAAAKVRITVTDGGTPADYVSVSPDRYMWYMPRNGELALDLLPGDYRFRGLCGNRVLYADCTVPAEAASAVVLDIGKAPRSPELLTLDMPAREYGEFPLEISGADNVSIDGGIDHVRVVRQGDGVRENGFALSVDASRLSGGFYHVALKAQNEWGESKTHVGIRLPRGDAVPVRTAEDLNAVRSRLSGSYRLMNDIDMSGVHDWLPIGTKEYPFTGVFDGGGYEITGFHAPDSIPDYGETDDTGFGLFGVTEHAEIRGLILREPEISPRDAPTAYYSALITQAYQSLIENCAVVGGTVAPAGGQASGVIALADNCILTGLFNSADVFCAAPNGELPNTAGVCGIFIGYGARLANEGEVHGTHLTGGIVGYQNSASLFRCVNSGYIWGSTMVGEFPAGAIMQTNELDSVTADCYFTIGSAPTGGNNAVVALTPIPPEDLKNPASFPRLGSFDGEAPDWTYAGTDAAGPVPYGIFERK